MFVLFSLFLNPVLHVKGKATHFDYQVEAPTCAFSVFSGFFILRLLLRERDAFLAFVAHDRLALLHLARDDHLSGRG
jgi:peptidoglycan/LPS O-acetylase OafA/YrhL